MSFLDTVELRDKLVSMRGLQRWLQTCTLSLTSTQRVIKSKEGEKDDEDKDHNDNGEKGKERKKTKRDLKIYLLKKERRNKENKYEINIQNKQMRERETD